MVRDAFVTASSTKEVETVYGEGKAELIDEVEAMVKAQTDSLGIIVDKIYLIGSMRLPASVVTAIDDKIKATQEAKKMENEVQKTIAQALKKVEASRGDSLSSVITAAGQAQANRLLNASITPSLLKFKEIEMYENTWDGKVSQVAGGAGVLLNLGK
jgi:regulator of protease activity HflC (stomatin/prohibitin superfamily)